MVQIIEEALNALNAGDTILLAPSDKTDNPAYLVASAEFLTLKTLQFMLEVSKGVLHLIIDNEITDRLDFHSAVESFNKSHDPIFLKSVDCVANPYHFYTPLGKLHTIKEILKPHSKSKDFNSPGNILPLKVSSRGVLYNKGIFESSLDLIKMCSRKKAAIVCPIISQNGGIVELQELAQIINHYHLIKITPQDVFEYRVLNEVLVQEKVSVRLPINDFGEFKMILFHNEFDPLDHFVLFKPQKDLSKAPIVRIHSECLTGDLLGSLRCDCGPQLQLALKMISEEGGLLIYLRQEGRGIGLVNKLKAYVLQDLGKDTVEANLSLGLPIDNRDYFIAYQFLKHFKIDKIRLLTNNPEKIAQLERCNIKVEQRLPIHIEPNPQNKKYLKTKKEKLGHLD